MMDETLLDAALSATAKDIREVTNDLAELLIRKNAAYGDSALNPNRTFSSAPAGEQIKVRLDDKLSRIRTMVLRGTDEDAMGEDVIGDLLGYLVLLRISQKRAKRLPKTEREAQPPNPPKPPSPREVA